MYSTSRLRRKAPELDDWQPGQCIQKDKAEPPGKRARHYERMSELFRELQQHMRAALQERANMDLRERDISRVIAENFPLTFSSGQAQDLHVASPAAEHDASMRNGASSPCLALTTTTVRSKVTPTPASHEHETADGRWDLSDEALVAASNRQPYGKRIPSFKTELVKVEAGAVSILGILGFRACGPQSPPRGIH